MTTSPINPHVSQPKSSQKTPAACKKVNKREITISSCNSSIDKKKCKTWQELSINTQGKLVMMKVVDSGVATSTRRRKRSHKINDLGAATCKVLREKVHQKHQGKRQQNREEAQQEQNKQQGEPETAIAVSARPEVARLRSSESVKKTYPQEKVKTVSSLRRKNISKNVQCSPTLKRQTPTAARTDYSPRRQEQSRKNFKKLLSTWEDYTTGTLTSAVIKRTKLENFVDGQSRLALENGKENLEMGDCPLIGGGLGKSEGFGGFSQ